MRFTTTFVQTARIVTTCAVFAFTMLMIVTALLDASQLLHTALLGALWIIALGPLVTVTATCAQHRTRLHMQQVEHTGEHTVAVAA